MPDDGDAFLRVQRLEDGADRIHLDLHVEAPREAADRAVALGATEVADHGYVVLTSPGGFAFCFVPHPRREPSPTDHLARRALVARRPGVPRHPGVVVRP